MGQGGGGNRGGDMRGDRYERGGNSGERVRGGCERGGNMRRGNSRERG